MKKFLSLLLALSMLLALVACSGGGNANSGGNDNQGGDQQDEQPNDTQNPEDSGETRPNRLIYGTSTQMTGELGTYGWFNNNATDFLICRMVHGGTSNGYITYAANPGGEFIPNPTVLDGDVVIEKHEDGTRTVTTKIQKDLTWNNGEPITAYDYVAYSLVASSPQAKKAGYRGTPDSLVGGVEYQNGVDVLDENGEPILVKYNEEGDPLRVKCDEEGNPLLVQCDEEGNPVLDENGEYIPDENGGYIPDENGEYVLDENGKALKEYPRGISSLHVVDEYTFSFDITADYADYFYLNTLLASEPLYLPKFGADLKVVESEEGAYLEGTLTSEAIVAVRDNYNSPVTCGPYILKSADMTSYSATLEINPYYKGNYEGVKPSIQQIVVTYVNDKTQFDNLTTGGIDILNELGDAEGINKGLDLVETGGYDYRTYDRNGYGYLAFVCDGGPTQFKEVRHAVAHLLDRNEFCNKYTGGYGIVTHGPYGTGMWQTQESEEFFAENLDPYNYDPNRAAELLDEGGWTLDENGDDYSGEGVRWKEVTAEEAGNYKWNKTLADGRILMPLEIEWYTTPDNPVAELLATMLMNGPQTAAAGVKINMTVMEFGELQSYANRLTTEDPKYGGYNCGMFNMATGFTAAYEQWPYYVDSPDHPYDSWDHNKLYDKEMYQVAYDMVYGVDPSDRASYLAKFQEFIDMWNDNLPDLPLYSNTYHTFFRDWLKDYEPDSMWGFEYAIIYAHIEGAE